MRISTLLAIVAVLSGVAAANSAVYAADQQVCHLQPVADSNAALRHSQTVGVLYSEDTLSNLEYLQQYHDVAMGGIEDGALDPRIQNAFVQSSDPKLAIDWLQASLRKAFASVTVYDSLDALMQARPDVVVKLDTYNQLVTQANTRAEASYVATFYDSNLQYIGRAEGYGGKALTSIWVQHKPAAQIAAQINQQRVLQVNALKQFDASLNALVAPAEVARVAAN